MIKTSIIIAKIKRNGVKFKDTFLWNNRPDDLQDANSINLLLNKDEEVIVVYRCSGYCWVLTNRRFFIPEEMATIFLSDIIEVDFKRLKENPLEKTTNDELNLITSEKEYIVYFEEKTWPLFYDIFKFIILNIKKRLPQSDENDKKHIE